MGESLLNLTKSKVIPLKNGMALLMVLALSIIFVLKTVPVFAQDDFNALIKQVEINSQRSYDNINTVSFKGHSNTYVYFSYKPFGIKFIPFMDEYFFDGFWMKPDSLRLIIKARRTVEPDSEKMKMGGMLPLPNPFQFLYDPSAFEKQTTTKDNGGAKVWPLYPFALGADSLYHYFKDYEIGFGENKILGVKVVPKDPTIPAVIGTYQIDPDRYIVAGSDVIFNEAASYSYLNVKRESKRATLSIGGSANHRVKTKKALLHSSYWLPINIEEEFEIRIMGVKAKVYRLIEFRSYIVNPEKPDSSTIVNKKIVYERDPVLEKKLFKQSPYPNRLTKQEQEQIIKKIEDKFSSFDLFSELLESETMAQEAVRMGLEQRIGRYFRFAQRLGNFIQYNRIEGLRLNYGFNITNIPLKHSIISLTGGYGFKDKRWKGEIAMLNYLDNQRKIFLEGNLYNTITYEESHRLITTGKNTFTSLLYKGDYRDYFYKAGGNISIGYRATDNLALKFSIVSHTEEGASNHTNFSLFKRKQQFRTNPEIVEGKFRGLRATILYRSYNFDANIFAEYTDKNTLHSDFSYSFVKANLRRSYRPTYHSNLNLYVAAGVSSGYLTPQRWFDFGGKTFLNYYGNLRGIGYKAFTGDRMVYATVEYSIKGGALYDLGVKSRLIKAFKLTLWSGIGWSSLSDKSIILSANLNAPTKTTVNVYSEFGVGIGDLFNIIRVDFIRNSISKNKFLISFNVLR